MANMVFNSDGSLLAFGCLHKREFGLPYPSFEYDYQGITTYPWKATSKQAKL